MALKTAKWTPPPESKSKHSTGEVVSGESPSDEAHEAHEADSVESQLSTEQAQILMAKRFTVQMVFGKHIQKVLGGLR